MKLYLAHNFSARLELRALVVPQLQNKGHKITSRWILGDDHLFSEAIDAAVIDLVDIQEADAIVLFSDKHPDADSHGRGKFFELGYALAIGKICYVCGQDHASCVFYNLPRIRRIRSIDEIDVA